jgi:hypothetical protein
MNSKDFLNEYANIHNAHLYDCHPDPIVFLSDLTGYSQDHKFISILESALLDILEEESFLVN